MIWLADAVMKLILPKQQMRMSILLRNSSSHRNPKVVALTILAPRVGSKACLWGKALNWIAPHDWSRQLMIKLLVPSGGVTLSSLPNH